MRDSQLTGLFALIGSLVAYGYAQAYQPKDRYPLMLIGGFMGKLWGDYLAEYRQKVREEKKKG